MTTSKRVTPVIGIDLGTVYSCVGVWQYDRVEIIPDDLGNRTMPSFVAFTPTDRLIGEAAKNQVTSNPINTIFDVKRLIGRRFSDPEVQKDMKLWPFKVIEGAYDIPKIVVTYLGKEEIYSAEEISSMILIVLKNNAEGYLGTTVNDAVITVPAYFNKSQRQATKDAGHLAGLNVLQIIDEPTAAAIAYGLDSKTDITRETNVLIFDLGECTFDVTVVTINGKGDQIQVKAIDGDTYIGGRDIDNIMLRHFVKEFNKKHKTDISGNLKALGRLRIACEYVKRALCSTSETTIDIDNLHQSVDFSRRITRAMFEELNANFFSNCIKIVTRCLSKAKISERNVDEVVLVGASAKIPKIQQLLRELFQGKEPINRIDANEVVAYGAATLGAELSGEGDQSKRNLKLLDIVPLSFGVDANVAEMFSGEINQTKKNSKLLDVVPLSLGVDAHDGIFSVIIPRKTPIPAKKERTYFTTTDYQTSLLFNVYQGERSRAKDNKWLGKFQVAVPLAPLGKSKVKVVFNIAANGILDCLVKELTTGLKKKIIIDEEKYRLSEEDIEKMIKDAEKYKVEDQAYKKKMFARNVLDEYIYNVKRKIKTISTDQTRLHMEDTKKMENAIKEASQYLDVNKLVDVDEYEKVLNQLEEICVRVIAQLV